MAAGVHRNPDSTVRVLDLSDTAVAQLVALIGGGLATTVDQGAAGTAAWLVSDAAEDIAVTWQPIDFSTAGAHTIVAVAPGQRLRLRRFLPTTGSVPDATGDPVLTLTLGGQSLRSQALIGRFDILGDDGEDLVITSSKAAQVDGTVGYIIE